jgi:hypothetical protein
MRRNLFTTPWSNSLPLLCCAGKTSYFDQLAEVNEQNGCLKRPTFQDYPQGARERNRRTRRPYAVSPWREVQNYLLLSNTPAGLTANAKESVRHELLCGLTPYYTERLVPGKHRPCLYRNPIFH